MNPDLALIGARLLEYGGTLVLVGAAWFPLFGLEPDQDWPKGLVAWRKGLLAACALLSLIGGVLWLVLTAAAMNGDAPTKVSLATVESMITDTDFGRLWVGRLALNLALLVSVPWVRRGWWFPLLGTLLAVSLAGTGHAQAEDGGARLLHMGADAIHILAAGVWIGSLVMLAWLAARLPEAPVTESALKRFSGVGQLAVAALIATGLINAWYVVADSARLVSTRYGVLLDVKLLAFVGMIGLAALNRFYLVPRLAADVSRPRTIKALNRQILLEQLLAVVVIVVVSMLGVADPAAPL